MNLLGFKLYSLATAVLLCVSLRLFMENWAFIILFFAGWIQYEYVNMQVCYIIKKYVLYSKKQIDELGLTKVQSIIKRLLRM